MNDAIHKSHVEKETCSLVNKRHSLFSYTIQFNGGMQTSALSLSASTSGSKQN